RSVRGPLRRIPVQGDGTRSSKRSWSSRTLLRGGVEVGGRARAGRGNGGHPPARGSRLLVERADVGVADHVGHGPAVEVVLAHELLRKALHGGDVTATLGGEEELG